MWEHQGLSLDQCRENILVFMETAILTKTIPATCKAEFRILCLFPIDQQISFLSVFTFA